MKFIEINFPKKIKSLLIIITFLTILIQEIYTKSLKRTKTNLKLKFKSKSKTKTKTKGDGYRGSAFKIRKLENEQKIEDKEFDVNKFRTDSNKNFQEGEDFGDYYINLNKLENSHDFHKYGLAVEFKKEPTTDSLLRKLTVKASKYTFYFPYRNIVNVSIDPLNTRSLIIEYNSDFFDDKFYMISMTFEQDVNMDNMQFILKTFNAKVKNVKKFLLAKKKILIDAVKTLLTTKINDKKVESGRHIAEVKKSSKEFFLPDNRIFSDVDKEIKNKNYNAIYKRLNKLNPVGFTHIVTAAVR